jgi:hypothetical protein
MDLTNLAERAEMRQAAIAQMRVSTYLNLCTQMKSQHPEMEDMDIAVICEQSTKVFLSRLGITIQ